MNTQDDYIGECKGLAFALAEDFPGVDLPVVLDLVDNAEAPIAMILLAWMVDASGLDIPLAVITEIQRLIAGFESDEELPPRFRGVDHFSLPLPQARVTFAHYGRGDGDHTARDFRSGAWYLVPGT